MGKAGRHLFDVEGHQHHDRRSRPCDQRGDPPQHVLAAAEIEPGRWLVEQQQLGIGHQRARDLNSLALALGERAEPPPDQVRAANSVKQLDRAGDVERVVLFACAAKHAIAGGHHQVDNLLSARHLLGDRRA